MTTKVYAIHGRATAILRIPTGSGKAEFSAEFANGLPGAGANYRPATFSTTDPMVQKILESSPHFQKTYVLWKVLGGNAAKKASGAKPVSKPIELERLDGVETKEEAVAYLKAKGAKATDLKDDDSIRKFAEKLGVCFPNLYE